MNGLELRGGRQSGGGGTRGLYPSAQSHFQTSSIFASINKSEFVEWFAELDPDGTGYVDTFVARDFLKKSELSDEVLFVIWEKSDVDGDGRLSESEFYTACSLVLEEIGKLERIEALAKAERLAGGTITVSRPKSISAPAPPPSPPPAPKFVSYLAPPQSSRNSSQEVYTSADDVAPASSDLEELGRIGEVLGNLAGHGTGRFDAPVQGAKQGNLSPSNVRSIRLRSPAHTASGGAAIASALAAAGTMGNMGLASSKGGPVLVSTAEDAEKLLASEKVGLETVPRDCLNGAVLGGSHVSTASSAWRGPQGYLSKAADQGLQTRGSPRTSSGGVAGAASNGAVSINSAPADFSNGAGHAASLAYGSSRLRGSTIAGKQGSNVRVAVNSPNCSPTANADPPGKYNNNNEAKWNDGGPILESLCRMLDRAVYADAEDIRSLRVALLRVRELNETVQKKVLEKLGLKEDLQRTMEETRHELAVARNDRQQLLLQHLQLCNDNAGLLDHIKSLKIQVKEARADIDSLRNAYRSHSNHSTNPYHKSVAAPTGDGDRSDRDDRDNRDARLEVGHQSPISLNLSPQTVLPRNCRQNTEGGETLQNDQMLPGAASPSRTLDGANGLPIPSRMREGLEEIHRELNGLMVVKDDIIASTNLQAFLNRRKPQTEAPSERGADRGADRGAESPRKREVRSETLSHNDHLMQADCVRNQDTLRTHGNFQIPSKMSDLKKRLIHVSESNFDGVDSRAAENAKEMKAKELLRAAVAAEELRADTSMEWSERELELREFASKSRQITYSQSYSEALTPLAADEAAAARPRTQSTAPELATSSMLQAGDGRWLASALPHSTSLSQGAPQSHGSQHHQQQRQSGALRSGRGRVSLPQHTTLQRTNSQHMGSQHTTARSYGSSHLGPPSSVAGRSVETPPDGMYTSVAERMTLSPRMVFAGVGNRVEDKKGVMENDAIDLNVLGSQRDRSASPWKRFE